MCPHSAFSYSAIISWLWAVTAPTVLWVTCSALVTTRLACAAAWFRHLITSCRVESGCEEGTCTWLCLRAARSGLCEVRGKVRDPQC